MSLPSPHGELPEPEPQFPRPIEGTCTRADVGGVWFTVPTYSEDHEYGPALISPLWAGALPDPGDRLLVVGTGTDQVTYWVVMWAAP